MAEQQSIATRAAGWPARTKDYFEELQLEMKRVTWPNKDRVQSTTLVVLVSVFIFAAYFFVVDSVFLRLIGKLFQVFTKQS